MATCPMPWFPIYASEMLGDEDFLSWSPAERGCWITLSARCWADGSIPNDIDKMARLCGCDAQAMLKHWSSIASKFTEAEIPGRLVSKRIEVERSAAIAKAEKLRQRGESGAAARWAREKNEMPKQCLSNAKDMLTDGTLPLPLPIKEVLPEPNGIGSAEGNPLPKRSRKARGGEDLGNYPQELEQAMESWRHLRASLTSDDIRGQYKPEKVFIASSIGTREAVWTAWKKRLASTVRGRKVENAHVLAAVELWSEALLERGKAGEGCSCPMLPTLINKPDFVDALVTVMDDEVPHAS